MNNIKLAISIFLFSYLVVAQTKDPLLSKDFEKQFFWVDSIYNAMTLDEKIGQLFFIQANSFKSNNSEQINSLIKNQKIGGLIFSKGTPNKQITLTKSFQKKSKVPLLISMDAEWGLSMRLDSVPKFPWNMSLGSISNNNLIEKVGKMIGKQCKTVGVHLNFSPVVDINTNPKNPIIGNRSFGESKENVANKSISYMNGLQSQNILSTAKHFPGHGDTSKDSHKTLPKIKHKRKRILKTELYPYKKLIENGLPAIMVAHLEVPSLEKEKNLPSSLSKSIIKILKKNLKFKGLIITDALNMSGVTNYNENNIDLMAFLAGNDILLMSNDPILGISKIKEAVNSGNIPMKRLEQSVKKILKAKYKVGLNNKVNLHSVNNQNSFDNQSFRALKQELVENIPALIKNSNSIIPLNLKQNKILNIRFGNAKGDEFSRYLNKYSKVDSFVIDDSTSVNDIKILSNQYEIVLTSFHYKSETPWKNMGTKITENESKIISSLDLFERNILISFNNPYFLSQIDLNNFESIIVAYQNDILFQKIVAQQLFGAISFNGALPVSLNKDFKIGKKIVTEKINILSYSEPIEVGFKETISEKIDSIVKYAINEKMIPGAQVVVSKDSKIIHEKGYGNFRYSKSNKVTTETMYDLASLTKILVTTPLLMKLVHEQKIKISDRIGSLIPRYENSNKSNITIKELLSGYAGLVPWIPFYRETLNNDLKPSKDLYTFKPEDGFNLKVAPNLYLKESYRDSIFEKIKISPISDEKAQYSDLAFLMLQEYIENEYQENLDQIIKRKLFNEIGVDLTYNPSNVISTKYITPSEMDNYFRHKEIHGYVHDMAASMMGGIAGHAGLFGSAIEVAKIMQLFLQGGEYGDLKFLNKEIVDLFNTCHYCEYENRRGLGFDKPQIEGDGPTCGCLSNKSFGHSGWTGTYTWADPETDIVYVFLSNRSYPDGEAANKSKLVKENIRSEIQRIIYQSLD